MQTMTPKSKFISLSLPLVGGGQFDLVDMSPKKFSILVAYRGVHCPKCKTQLKEIDDMYQDLSAAGFDVIAMSMDSEDRAARAKKDWEISHLPIAYDLPLRTAKNLGLFISDKHGEKEPEFFSEPGLFVVKPDGTLYAQYIQNTPFGRPVFADIINGLNFVIEHDYPTRGTSTK